LSAETLRRVAKKWWPPDPPETDETRESEWSAARNRVVVREYGDIPGITANQRRA